MGGWGWGVSDEWIKRSTICQKLFVGGAKRLSEWERELQSEVKKYAGKSGCH